MKCPNCRLDYPIDADPGRMEFEVTVNGEYAAGGSAPREDAMREALHYAAAYCPDGEVKIYEIIRIEVTP